MAHLQFTIDEGAQLAYSIITELERDALDSAMARLVHRPAKQWPKLGAAKLKSAKPLYLIHVDESLRAFVQPGLDGHPELLHLVRQELLDRYFKGDGETVTSP